MRQDKFPSQSSMQARKCDISGSTTLVERIRYWATAKPEREAFVFRRHDGTRYPLSRATYLSLATRFAARLQSLGLQPGDVVCNFLANSPERAVTDLGIMLSGAAPMNGASLLADGANVKGCLRKGKAKALVVDPDRKDEAWEVCQRILKPCEPGPCEIPDLPDLKQVMYSRRSESGAMLLFEELEASSDQFSPVSMTSEDVAYIFTTSGSTGFSKLAVHTHGSLLRSYRDLTTFMHVTEDSIIWNDASLGWMGGFPHWLFAYGFTRVLTDVRAGKPSDHLEFLWKSLAEEKVSAALFLASHIDASLKRPELWKGRHELTYLFTGGQPTGRGCLNALASSGGFTRIFTVTYGCTELNFVTCANFEFETEFEEFLVGKPAPEMKVKIVDDNLTTLPAGRRGEILVKSESPLKGYLGDEDKTKKAFTQDGWFRTNDLGYLDDRGRLFVVGRLSHAIMRGAFILVPQWLEVRVRSCPGVKDVVIVAVPDEVLCNEICACVIREDGSEISVEDLESHCQSLFLSGVSEEKNQKPRYYLFFQQFPLNTNLKTDRRELAKVAAEKLGLK